jgi:hypothetical protein
VAQSPVMLRRAALVLVIAISAGCARPYAGPKTVAAIGGILLAGGGASWAVGERTNRRALVVPGFISTLVGAAAVVAAGGWLAASVGCRADPDCPEREECKEVPAPPGGIPYKQCMRR